jgi:metallo-beta-lactamase class B
MFTLPGSRFSVRVLGSRFGSGFVFAVLGSVAVAAQSASALRADAPIRCTSCDEWNQPHKPFRVFGNTYFVGTSELAAVLVTSPRGHVLLDGGLPQSAPLVGANIAALGFKLTDVRLIAYSHAHFDHVGGIAALQRVSGAPVASSAAGARSLRSGAPTADDPQALSGQSTPFARVTNIREIQDGETVRVGELALTAHLTPGHTPGGTTWTWRSCEGERCLSMVYADSLTAVSDDGFRFAGDATHSAVEETFRRSIATVAELPCDILLAPHPGFVGMDEKLRRRDTLGDANAFIDSRGCRSYAADASRRLDERLVTERQELR